MRDEKKLLQLLGEEVKEDPPSLGKLLMALFGIGVFAAGVGTFFGVIAFIVALFWNLGAGVGG